MKIQTLTGSLYPTAPFDFERTLDFLGSFTPMHGEQTLAPRAVTKTITVDGQAVLFQLVSQGTPDAPRLEYRLMAGRKWDDGIRELALDRIRFFLSLEDDLRPFYEIGRRDDSFAPVLDKLYGLHHVKFPSPFENAVWAILTQRTPMRVAHKVKAQLVAQYGSSLTANGVEYRAFPEPAALLPVPQDTLRALIGNERKADYLRAVVDAFASADEHFLREGDTDEVRRWLRQIKGLGQWSADFVLLRGLGHMDSFQMLAGSLPEKRTAAAVSEVYGHGKPLAPPQIMELAERYGRWRGYWVYYLRTLFG